MIHREDFPILKKTNRGKPIIYLDSASSAQKPRQVVEAMSNFYFQDYANVHRGIYELSERANRLYEEARHTVKTFIGASFDDEIVFVRGTTEGINLVAQSYGKAHLQKGDEILVSVMEHHSNLVPWVLLKEQIGIELKIIPITDQGVIDLEAYKKLFSPRTKLVAISHASNVMGTINPVEEMTKIAHQHQACVVIDGAQAAPHFSIDMQEINCDFYVFSAHKLYGPTGIGVLYGKRERLNQMPPYQGGGGMIETVSFEKITYAKAPHKFEAGTPDMTGVIGLQAAIQYLQAVGFKNIDQQERELLQYAEEKLLNISSLRMIGTAKPKVGVISFVLASIHPHDVGTVLDHEGIAVRAGHHCAMPLMERFSVPATVRVSFGLYNTKEEIDALVEAIYLAKKVFA